MKYINALKEKRINPLVPNALGQEESSGHSLQPPVQMFHEQTGKQSMEYTVLSGETIEAIAAKFGISRSALIASNDVHSFKTKSGKKVLGFKTGQKISIPDKNHDQKPQNDVSEEVPNQETSQKEPEKKGLWSSIMENITQGADTVNEGLISAGEKVSKTIQGIGDTISGGYQSFKDWIGGGKVNDKKKETEEGLPENEKEKENLESSPAPEIIVKALEESVGKDGKNKEADVTIVQHLLNTKWGYSISITGKVDDKTIQAIRQFQHRYAGVIKKQDARIDPDGNSWKYLIGELTPIIGKSDDGLLGGAETDTEKKMAEFTNNMMNIEVNIGNGETVVVRPPYHINLGNRKTNSDAARKKAPKVYAIIKTLGFGGSVGKATPAQMKSFLEQAIEQGLATDKTSQGLHNFMATYGVSTDCSGLAVQAANFLIQGNMDRTDKDSEVIPIMNTEGIQGAPKVKSPSSLQAGDMMVNYKRGGTSTYHVRVITDVDTAGEGIQFSTLESGSSSNLGDGGNGVGQVRWEFPDGSKFENLKKLAGNTWITAGKSDQNYTYTRFKELGEV